MLKALFECLRDFKGSGIKSTYCYISRKVVYAAKDNLPNASAILSEYLKPFIEKNQLVFVDEGWYCHSQQFLTEIYNLDTLGLYLGVRGRNEIKHEDICSRNGVLFDIDKDGRGPSKYYGIFCTNCSLYEQMLTSPEGSVVAYQRTGKSVEPILKDNPIERDAYQTDIKDWQERLLISFKALCVWQCGKPIKEKQVANVFLHADLFNSRERCKFINKIDASKVDNFFAARQVAKNIKNVHINILDLLLHPSMYLYMACKVQRKVYDKPIANFVYTILARLFYYYVKVMGKLL